MSALVDSFFTVRGAAWHDVTKENDHDRNPQTVDEALEWAGLTWEPINTPVFFAKHSRPCQSKDVCPNLAVAAIDGKYFACAKHSRIAEGKGMSVAPIPIQNTAGWNAVIRSDTGDVLDIAPSTRELFLNRQTFELLEMLLTNDPFADPNRDPDAPQPQDRDESLPVEFETGGALKGGRLVWALARLNAAYFVEGANGAKDASPIFPFASVLNSHDGTSALKAMLHKIRIVCWNTWSAAEQEASKTGREFTFRHTGSIHSRVDEAKEVLFRTRQSTEEWVEYANLMIARPWSDAQMNEFLELYVPMPPAEAVSDRVADNVFKSRDQIKTYYNSASCASIHGTAWGAIQAVGEFLDHGREYRTKESYVSRTMLKSEPGKKKALSLIKELVNA